TGSDKFAPSATTTRAMLMTVLARYAGEDTTGGATWYEKSMEWAKAKGVSDGTNPNANITREQLVTMMYRYAGSPKADGKLDSFSDATSVSTYAADAMQWAVANGIVNGSNGKLNPQDNATRAEVAAILMRFCEMSK
ncbi:S-layer homology domain-containing protein, partial [Butyricicoccus sp.]|uniref:S-layer homology domain-containing protein n=1 Tax=Butyricicoccus sp. TaxID=2049021 RepID=UPI003AAFB04F